MEKQGGEGVIALPPQAVTADSPQHGAGLLGAQGVLSVALACLGVLHVLGYVRRVVFGVQVGKEAAHGGEVGGHGGRAEVLSACSL